MIKHEVDEMRIPFDRRGNVFHSRLLINGNVSDDVIIHPVPIYTFRVYRTMSIMLQILKSVVRSRVLFYSNKLT